MKESLIYYPTLISKMSLGVVLFFGGIATIVIFSLIWFLYIFDIFSSLCRYDSANGYLSHDTVPEEQIQLAAVVVETTSEKRRIEGIIFEKSFDLIAKFNSHDFVLKTNYLNAYNTSENGIIDWNEVFPNLNSKNKGYVAAIERTSSLLPRDPSPEKTEIYSLVSKLIAIREEENKRHKHLSENKYEEHKRVIEAWNQFKQYYN